MRFLLFAILSLAWEASAFDVASWRARRAAFSDEAREMRVAYSNVASRVSESAERVNVPIETHADGSVKLLVTAERAQFLLKEDLVWAADVVVSQFDETACEILRIEADRLLFSRENHHGWAEGRAKVTYGKSVFTGENVFFSTDDEYVLSLDASAFETRELPQSAAASTNAFLRGESLAVSSRRCDMDRKSGVVLFEDAARVDYRPDYTLVSDRVYAFFEGTNNLSRLVAEGGVSITNGLRRGTCARAVFSRASDEVVMTGSPDGRLARLRDETANEVAGRKITFFLKAEQVEIEDAELIVNKSGRSMKDL